MQNKRQEMRSFMSKHIKRGKRDNRAGGSRAAPHFVHNVLRGVGGGNERETYDPVPPGRRVSSVAGILLIITRLI